jgi:hypothetical protein
MTPQGQQAYKILDWAYEDPQARAAEAVRKVDVIARAADGDALREVQDAGTILSRLAGTVSGGATTISGQLST